MCNKKRIFTLYSYFAFIDIISFLNDLFHKLRYFVCQFSYSVSRNFLSKVFPCNKFSYKSIFDFCLIDMPHIFNK